MITPDGIVSHIRTYLPTLTDRFTDEITASGTASGNTVTVTAAGHNLTAGIGVVVISALYNNRITAVTLDPDGTALLTTDADHDLTAPRRPDDDTLLTLAGLPSPWSGQHAIVAVPSARTFRIATPAGETVAPSIANAALVESRSFGLTGRQTVASSPDADTFTIDVPADRPPVPDGLITGLRIATGVRVLGAATAARAEQMYTQMASSKPFMFVIMGDVTASKDPLITNDAVSGNTPQDTRKQVHVQNFSTLCYFPTAESDASGFSATQFAYGQLFGHLLKVLYGVDLNNGTSAVPYTAVSNGHGPMGAFNTAYYAHAYDWQISSVILYDRGFGLTPDVAFRSIGLTLYNNEDRQAPLTATIDLNEGVT